MVEVNVRIKDEKHAKKVIERLVRVGYKEYEPRLTLPYNQVKTISVYDDGDYQLLNYKETIEIKPKYLMKSEPVKYFLEHNHV
jgi:hypothetical protein